MAAETIASLDEICIHTRSYICDLDLAPYLYRSIERHVADISDVVLVVEEQDVSAFRSIIPGWVRLIAERKFAPGTIQQKYSKLVADTHTSKQFIWHIDTDSIFVRRPEIKDLFLGNKPYAEVIRFEDLLAYQEGPAHTAELKAYILDTGLLKNELRKELVKMGIEDIDGWLAQNYTTWLQDNFEPWFANWFASWKNSWGLDVWRQGTEYAIGDTVDYEFNVTSEKLYPRGVYSICREVLERNHGVGLEDFIKSRVGVQAMDTPRKQYFSDHNFIGAVLHKYMHSSMEWVHVTSKRDEDRYAVRRRCIQQFNSYDMVENGKLKDAAREMLEAAMKAAG
jgi:hypothetical protein